MFESIFGKDVLIDNEQCYSFSMKMTFRNTDQYNVYTGKEESSSILKLNSKTCLLDTLKIYNNNNKRIIEFQKNEIENLKEYILEPDKQEKMEEMKRVIVNIKEKSKIIDNELKKIKIEMEICKQNNILQQEMLVEAKKRCESKKNIIQKLKRKKVKCSKAGCFTNRGKTMKEEKTTKILEMENESLKKNLERLIKYVYIDKNIEETIEVMDDIFQKYTVIINDMNTKLGRKKCIL